MANSLYTGIDVSLNTLVLGVINQSGTHLTKAMTFRNNQPQTQQLVNGLAQVATDQHASALIIATEATGFLDWHLLEYLASSETLAPLNPAIYRLNPRQVKKFSEISSQTDKTDKKDAFLIANYLRFQLPAHPFNVNMDYVPLQRLTRFRKHIVEQMTVEKNYFLNHLFLKFSAYRQVKPFSDHFGATSQAFLSEFFSVDEVANIGVEELMNFVIKHGKNHFPKPEEVVNELKQVAHQSYRTVPR
jgi:hypothetical protein